MGRSLVGLGSVIPAVSRALWMKRVVLVVKGSRSKKSTCLRLERPLHTACGNFMQPTCSILSTYRSFILIFVVVILRMILGSFRTLVHPPTLAHTLNSTPCCRVLEPEQRLPICCEIDDRIRAQSRGTFAYEYAGRVRRTGIGDNIRSYYT